MTSGVAGTKGPHGTINRYKNHGCRCDACRAAWATYMREYNHRTGRARPMAEATELRRTAAHGTETRASRCKCADCRRAANEARNRRRRDNGPGPNAVHGTNSTYSSGCRCDECRIAHTDYCRERRRARTAA